MTEQKPKDRVKLYKVGAELEDDNYAIVCNGRIVPYDNGEKTAPSLEIALPRLLAIGALPPGSVVYPELRCNSLREIELREIHIMLVDEINKNAAFAEACATATPGRSVAFYGPSEWAIVNAPDEQALWNVLVMTSWQQAVVGAVVATINSSIASALNKGHGWVT